MKKSITSNLVLKQRDHAILKILYEHRFLSGELIWYLIKNDSYLPFVSYSIGSDGKTRPITYGFKKQALSKRLKQLYDAGYLERHYMTDQPLGRGYGSPRAIYALGKQSPKVLLELKGIPIKETKRIIESNNVKSPFLRHALELATFKVILQLACQSSRGKVKLLFWGQGDAIRDYVNGVNEKGIKERFPIHADAFFGLTIADKKNKHFFLEIDRGTEPIVSKTKRSNIRRKLIGYQHYYKSKRISDRYSLHISGFQVLIVTPGKIESTKNVSGRIANILQELTLHRDLYPSKSLFALTTKESMSLENPLSIFNVIWVSPKYQKRLLSFTE